ncbi:MAG: hypothetical protein Q8O67_04475 [Deltaproteobacteria bacterium]|nr:hypothetical protein [Deltaproteobacteria bacterium]
MRSHSSSTALGLVVVVVAAGCPSPALLYDPIEIPSQPNKVAFTGSVCTDNPAERSFPLRVVFLVDASAEPLTGLDGAGQATLQTRRVDSIRDVVATLRAPDTAFSLVRFGGEALLQPEGGFTENASEIVEAAGSLTVAVPCSNDGCRRTGQALSIASSLVTGDLFSTARGPRSRTKYVLVLVQNGPTDDLVLEGSTTPECDVACVLQGRVADLRAQVIDGGGADLQLHAIDLATLDDDDADRATAQDQMQRMCFAGSGEYNPVCPRDGNGDFLTTGCGPQNLSIVAVDINSARNVFLKKSFVVANLNALTRPDGTTVPDSDSDGLADDEEPAFGTNPGLRDTDGDGIGDKVELLLQTTGINPLVPDDPVTCAFLDAEVRFTQDTDGDGLLDCEEALLRLDLTLFDSDSDGLPDPLEVLAGTNFLEDDGLTDADFDGSPNVDELRGHTDPRSADSKTRSQLAYLYREVDLGVRSLLFTSQPRTITGVVVEDIGFLSNTGNGSLSFIRNGERTLLAWRDAGEPDFGTAVEVGDSGVYTLPAACSGLGAGCDREVTVDVTSQLLPPASRDELLRVASAERQCTDFRVRNVTLVETIEADGQPEGHNDLRIFFGQVPQGAVNAFGIFRVAQFNFTFLAPDFKDPDVADQLVDDFRFVLFE